jgi:hypothetical protein
MVGAQPDIHRKPRKHSQKGNHGEEVLHEQQSFSDLGGSETSAWADPFRWTDLSYLRQENSQTIIPSLSKFQSPVLFPEELLLPPT